jgi:glycogen(starch) synthase
VKILFWTELFWPSIGGIEVGCRALAKGLIGRGHEVSVVTSQGAEPLADEDAIDGIRVHRFRFLEALNTKNVALFASERRRLASLKQRLRADVVHVQFTDPTVLFHWQTHAAAPSATVIGIPIGIESQQGGADTLLGRTLERADWVIAVSEAMLSDVRRLFPEIESRSSVIYNSVDEPSIEPRPLAFDPARLLCLGRLVPEKGFDVAIDAFAGIRDEFPGITLVIAGDGSARPALTHQVRSLGLDSAVEFTGWVQPDEVPALINRCTALIVPSRWREAFGIVAVQAMQMARPVVASDVGGLSEIVSDGITGYLIPAENPIILAQVLRDFLRDPVLAERLGKAGRSQAAARFPFHQHVCQHEHIYQMVVDRRRPPE